MTDLAQTATSVRVQATAKVQPVIAGETVVPGQPVYKLATDGEYYKAAATNATVAACKGIAGSYADDTDQLWIVTAGPMEPGATLVLGETYYVSDTSGKLMPAADVDTGEIVTSVGIATSTTVLEVQIQASGTARA